MGVFATLQPLDADVHLAKEGCLEESTHAHSRELDRFLAEVESKAFRIAQITLRHEQDALDAVQNAMLKLVRKYAHRPAQEWRPLFYRILENGIRDVQRHRTVRSRVLAWLPWNAETEDGEDPVKLAPDPAPGPVAQLQGQQAMAMLHAALGDLPARQRQAFLLRSFEGLDVEQTAQVMGCSKGSVKTHLFRAVQTLRMRLGDSWE